LNDQMKRKLDKEGEKSKRLRREKKKEHDLGSYHRRQSTSARDRLEHAGEDKVKKVEEEKEALMRQLEAMKLEVEVLRLQLEDKDEEIEDLKDRNVATMQKGM
jgi:ABC-type transport system involved in cytochrome bd biosynthesis fused ATPase/permease subunit